MEFLKKFRNPRSESETIFPQLSDMNPLVNKII